jgi:hypothetical protein
VSSVVSLIYFISGEVGGIDIRSKLWLEWCTNSAKSIEFNTTEELVVFDLIRTATTKSILGVADKTMT